MTKNPIAINKGRNSIDSKNSILNRQLKVIREENRQKYYEQNQHTSHKLSEKKVLNCVFLILRFYTVGKSINFCINEEDKGCINLKVCV